METIERTIDLNRPVTIDHGIVILVSHQRKGRVRVKLDYSDLDPEVLACLERLTQRKLTDGVELG